MSKSNSIFNIYSEISFFSKFSKYEDCFFPRYLIYFGYLVFSYFHIFIPQIWRIKILKKRTYATFWYFYATYLRYKNMEIWNIRNGRNIRFIIFPYFYTANMAHKNIIIIKRKYATFWYFYAPFLRYKNMERRNIRNGRIIRFSIFL